MTRPRQDHPANGTSIEVDLHVHTTASACGYMGPEEVVALARASGRKVIAVTDHDTAAGALQVRDYVARTGDDLLVLVGMELSTSDAGHVLVFGAGVEQDWGWRCGQATPRHLPDRWVAIKAHPFREVVKSAPPGLIVDDLPELPDSITAVERWNGNDLLVKAPHREADLDAASQAYIARRGRVAVAASDAHRATSVHAYHTVFSRQIASVDDVVDQIKDGSVRPGAVAEADLTARRVSWRRRRVIGWFVDCHDWRTSASRAGYDDIETLETVARFEGIRRLARAGASTEAIVQDSGLDAVTALDFLAIVREESLDPARVR
ncbi:MAG: PHP domain-containing protein [Chloroflexi bacterium]|nr:PHP domain-containing protein [Chloroflexota bacterium]